MIEPLRSSGPAAGGDPSAGAHPRRRRHRHSRHPVLRAIRITAGVVLILAGVVGGFIPILQGWVFILAGISLLSPESRTARRILLSIRLWAKAVRRRWRSRRQAPSPGGRPDGS